MLSLDEIHLKVAAGNDVEVHFTANCDFSTNVLLFDVRFNDGLSISGIKGKKTLLMNLNSTITQKFCSISMNTRLGCKGRVCMA